MLQSNTEIQLHAENIYGCTLLSLIYNRHIKDLSNYSDLALIPLYTEIISG